MLVNPRNDSKCCTQVQLKCMLLALETLHSHKCLCHLFFLFLFNCARDFNCNPDCIRHFTSFPFVHRRTAWCYKIPLCLDSISVGMGMNMCMCICICTAAVDSLDNLFCGPLRSHQFKLHSCINIRSATSCAPIFLHAGISWTLVLSGPNLLGRTWDTPRRPLGKLWPRRKLSLSFKPRSPRAFCKT